MTSTEPHTPTTENVRHAYAFDTWSYTDAYEDERRKDAFDRWLREHDAEVAERVQDMLVRRDCFTERTLRLIDEHAATVRRGGD